MKWWDDTWLFDFITYMKGAAVIRMFEYWVGEAAFQRGVRAYLKRYAMRNATSADFLGTIASAGESRLPAALSTFLKQSGVPRVSI